MEARSALRQSMLRCPRLRPSWARIQPPKVIGMECMELMDILWPTIARVSRVMPRLPFFFFNDTATTEIYTLSLHDALPILREGLQPRGTRVEPSLLTSI